MKVDLLCFNKPVTTSTAYCVALLTNIWSRMPFQLFWFSLAYINLFECILKVGLLKYKENLSVWFAIEYRTDLIFVFENRTNVALTKRTDQFSRNFYQVITDDRIRQSIYVLDLNDCLFKLLTGFKTISQLYLK